MAKGKRTYFPHKEQRPVTTNLTSVAHQSLDLVQGQTNNTSRSDLLEYSWRKLMGLDVPKELTELIRQAKASRIPVTAEASAIG